MNSIENWLRISLYDCMNGNRSERSECASLMQGAAVEITRLRAMLRQVSKCDTEWEGPNYRTIQVYTSLWDEIQRECGEKND